MRNIGKRVMAMFLCVLMLLGGAVSAFAADPPLEFTKDGIKYEIDPSLQGTTASVVGNDGSLSGRVVVPSTVIYNNKEYTVMVVEEYAFMGCDRITEIVVSEGVTVINAKAFADCTALRDVYLPDSLTVCAITAFNGCAHVDVHAYRGLSNIGSVARVSNISLVYVDPPVDFVGFFKGIYLLMVNMFNQFSAKVKAWFAEA